MNSSPLQTFKLPKINSEITENKLFIKREDLTHPEISGNKFWKLKYNLLEARRLGADTLVTFGGAMSNHIAATACAGYENAFKTIGIIRGDEIINQWRDNETLRRAADKFGMEFLFVTREEYRKKEHSERIRKYLSTLSSFYLVPEGGTNELAVEGASEILDDYTKDFDIIMTAVGTGGTLAGLSSAARMHQRLIGISSLKVRIEERDSFKDKVFLYSKKDNFIIDFNYNFGGYAKVSEELIEFINDFYELNNIPLDPIYTGKMLFALRDQLKKGIISSDKKILAIHTGGIQGIKEMNKKLIKKGFPLINPSIITPDLR